MIVNNASIHKGISQARLAAAIAKLEKDHPKATIKKWSPTSGVIDATGFFVNIHAQYSLEPDGTLTVSSNHGIDKIDAGITDALGASA